ncbi:ABC transporter ATP-binding protein [Methylobacterium sp. Leaf106]|uniref:ABC transporter ATP-binding protein n=1 Tax=Methylobacterium sp. Leaf106 TaxID=1736255 RepID=UPI0006F45C99|nr:ABC transporter ATP-binding protein [Methylobacterium sp. Leaf106]KQP41728.1 ABC transporter [Methylobacterium sp. Leaf106]
MSLEVQNLAFGYAAKTLGEGIGFTLKAGEVLGLLGPNGGGKTTLFKTLLGLLPAKAGRITLDGQDVTTWSRARFARSVAYVPQAHAAFFPFRVQDVVLMGRASRLGAFAAPGRADEAIALEALAILGIRHLSERRYTEISGGERQLVLIARALAGEPRFLVMDEPTASLDFGNQARVLDQVRRLKERGMGIVLSTHDPDHAFLCDTVALLHEGRLLALGRPEEAVTPETLRLLYGIDVAIVPLPGSGRFVCTPILHR